MESKLVTPSVHALVLVALLASADGQNLSLRLLVVSSTSDAEDACIGGDVGLADTSVLVQYRLFGKSTSEPSWIDLTDMNPKQGFNGTLGLHQLSISKNQSVQLRLLQLEHGGGSCNCWSVEEALITWNHNGDNVDIINGTHANCPRIENLFCDGNASQARGFARSISFQNSQPTCSDGIGPISRTQSILSSLNCSEADIKM